MSASILPAHNRFSNANNALNTAIHIYINIYKCVLPIFALTGGSISRSPVARWSAQILSFEMDWIDRSALAPSTKATKHFNIQERRKTKTKNGHVK